MESPPAIGIADPAATRNELSASPKLYDVGESSLFQSEAIQLGVVPVEGSAVQPANDTSFDGGSIGKSYDGRALDVLAAAILLVLVLPLMCLCAVAILGTSRGPLFYSQPRIGRGGRLFNCLKFRTMVDHADCHIEQLLEDSLEAKAEWQALQKLKQDPRITPLGTFLRRYSLDELPQLVNVLAGEMSIVGPRPIVTAEVERYGVNFAAYCSVKPGLTGLWQVSGRHRLPYPERVELDALYARSKTLLLDLLIIWRTVPIVLRGENH